MHNRDEAAGMWKSYLKLGDYVKALLHCRTSAEKNSVRLAQADELFENGDHKNAVDIYATVGFALDFLFRYWTSLQL